MAKNRGSNGRPLLPSEVRALLEQSLPLGPDQQPGRPVILKGKQVSCELIGRRVRVRCQELSASGIPRGNGKGKTLRYPVKCEASRGRVADAALAWLMA